MYHPSRSRSRWSPEERRPLADCWAEALMKRVIKRDESINSAWASVRAFMCKEKHLKGWQEGTTSIWTPCKSLDPATSVHVPAYCTNGLGSLAATRERQVRGARKRRGSRTLIGYTLLPWLHNKQWHTKKHGRAFTWKRGKHEATQQKQLAAVETLCKCKYKR